MVQVDLQEQPQVAAEMAFDITTDSVYDSSCVNSPTSRAATPCHGPSRKARALNCLTLLESTASDRS
eukprot:850027-Pleurochrysis_carterae.AAC.1